MDNLFYSPSEKILFYIAGHTDTENVKGLISMYKNNYDYFYMICRVKTINTLLVNESPRYKGMRVFYCVTPNPPNEAFNLYMDEARKNELLSAGYAPEQIEWTMIKWLTD